MTKGNTYTCRVCGKSYEYCPSCELTPNPIKENGFCCREHYDIFTVLSQHGCHLATAKETLAELDKLSIPTDLTSSVKAHIDAIREESKPVEIKSEPEEAKTIFYKKK